jgi:hypothetical protein
VEGCFEELTTTTTTTSPPTTTTTTTAAAVTGCSQPFNFNAPEGFPGVNTGNGIKTLSNGTILTMTSSPSGCNTVYIPGSSPQLDPNNWGDETCSLPGVHNNQFNNEGWYLLGSGSCAQTTLQFSESVGALAFYQSGIGYYPNPGEFETINVTGDVDLSISTIGVCEANPGDWQIINETDGSVTFKGRLFQGERGLVSLFAIYPRNPGDRIGELTFEHVGSKLGGVGLDFYLCPDDQTTTTTTTTVAPTTTTTTTTEVPNVKLNWDLSNGGEPINVTAIISRNGINTIYSNANDNGLVLCNAGDDIEITIQTAKTGIYAFTNRATLDGTIILNDTSIETDSKLSTVSFVKSAATEELDMIGLVQNTETTTTTTSHTTQIPVTGNSYFTFWSDVSGSMNSTIAVTAKIASVTGVKVLVSPTALAGSTEIQLTQGNQNNKVTVQDSSGNTTGGAYLCVVPGMEVIHPSIPAGTFVAAGSDVLTFNLVDINGNPVALTADITQGPNGVVTFNLTDAQKTADYQNTSNLRNLLQDFYATGLTEAEGNTDRATNGSDEFEARVYWCHSGQERQIQMLSNKGLGDTIGSTGYFPDADSLVIMAFGDESGVGYNMDGEFPTSGPRWANRASQTNSRIVDDISSVRTFVTNLESAAGNTNIYRAKFFHPEATSQYALSTIKPLVSPEGLLNAGNDGAAVVSSIGNVPASAYNSLTDNLINYPSASPARFAWSADLDNNPANPQQYWYDQIRDALIAFGYGV